MKGKLQIFGYAFAVIACIFLYIQSPIITFTTKNPAYLFLAVLGALELISSFNPKNKENSYHYWIVFGVAVIFTVLIQFLISLFYLR